MKGSSQNLTFYRNTAIRGVSENKHNQSGHGDVSRIVVQVSIAHKTDNCTEVFLGVVSACAVLRSCYVIIICQEFKTSIALSL